MSFISDSTIGMGDGDSKGSIQQPMVDRKVIQIGDSSEEETRHEASDSESSSSKTLTVSSRVGGGTSRLHRRTQLSTAFLDEEPVPITMIFPLSISGEELCVIAIEVASKSCVIATVLGRHRPLLLSLAMSG